MTPRDVIINKKVENTIKSLNANNMQGYHVKTLKEALELVKSLLKDAKTVGVGGSQTLFEAGVIDYLTNSQNHTFFNRYAEDADVEKVFRDSFTADAYLCSCNAITESGELYNVDGNSNRVAAIAYGPKSVIMLVSVDKIVYDLSDAIKHVKTITAPANCERLNCQTYCKEQGHCISLNTNGDMAKGCSGSRICCNYLISAYQRHKDRIKIIFIDEKAGF